ncbi:MULTISPECIES: hypothetical protein [unclassified Exiguobacterium]|uniref:hypothetical protein n=1 Tax=unclassified Exiguobacterium TaxID=2644629 RepID=UPI001BEC1D12|nr:MULTISPECIES: hypothetical protein [unclassified Exiguobacterium]
MLFINKELVRDWQDERYQIDFVVFIATDEQGGVALVVSERTKEGATRKHTTERAVDELDVGFEYK